jgi:type VI protein secretion system component Hcp
MSNPILGVAIALVLAAPCTALAQSPSLNFGKIEHEYKEQKPDGAARDPQSGLPTGKRMHKPYTVTKQVDSASPLLMNKPVGGSTGPTKPTLPTTGRHQ